MQDREILELRAEAQRDFQSQDLDIFRMHKNAVAALLDTETSEDVRVEALLTTREWEDAESLPDEHIRAWKSILAMEDEDAIRAILADTEEARMLRRGTPFSSFALNYPNG